MVVNAEKVKQSCMEIADVNDIVHRVVTQFVGCSVTKSGLDSGPRHPHRETLDMVVAACASFALEHRSAAKLAAPDHHPQEGVCDTSGSCVSLLEEQLGRVGWRSAPSIGCSGALRLPPPSWRC